MKQKVTLIAMCLLLLVTFSSTDYKIDETGGAPLAYKIDDAGLDYKIDDVTFAYMIDGAGLDYTYDGTPVVLNLDSNTDYKIDGGSGYDQLALNFDRASPAETDDVTLAYKIDNASPAYKIDDTGRVSF